jgi:L-histidine N-alpha-methyltransferase
MRIETLTSQSPVSTERADFAADVRAGLLGEGQKELPSKYFYDEVGSALFEAICVLPEYGLTRADERILQRHAASIVARMPSPVVVAELGSGSGRKTRWILEALCRRQKHPVTYHPIEISRTALERCEREMSAIGAVSVVGFERPYLDGLLAAAARRRDGEYLLVLFLGSTIGNFDRPASERFLRDVRALLFPGDALLLSADLVKARPVMLAAYDDPLGVTAAFNLNLLARINRELDGRFDLAQFEHRPIYNEAERRIEMHLRSRVAQTVEIGAAGIAVKFAEGETIWTENSHKYTPGELIEMAQRNGFRCDAQWIDSEWPFAQSLLISR